MNYIVLDLEFNQYFDFKDENYKDEPMCPFEIMQIGAVKLNENFETIDKMSFFIKPQIFTRMHPFVKKMTGIGMADLKHEPNFSEAYIKFINFIGPEKCVLCVWGSVDVKLLYKNILYHKLNGKLLTKKYIDVQQIASIYFKQPNNNSIGLKAAVEKLDLEKKDDFHDALNDAVYTSEVFKAVREPDMPIRSFNLRHLRQATFAQVNSVNSGLLFSFCERELGRALTDTDKEFILKVYSSGQNKAFDLKKE